jgi:hypothetical protein
LNLIEDFQTRIDARMAEIHPLVQEYHALQQLRGAITNLDPEAVAAHMADFQMPGSSGGLAGGQDGLGSVRTQDGSVTTVKAKRASNAKRSRAGNAARSPVEMPTQAATDDGDEQRIVELVKAEPGLTAAQLSERLDLPVSVLFRTLPLLQRDGLVRKQGKGFSVV